jgi:hypothetical protein
VSVLVVAFSPLFAGMWIKCCNQAANYQRGAIMGHPDSKKHPYGKGKGGAVTPEKEKATAVMVDADANPMTPVGLKPLKHMQMGKVMFALVNGELMVNGKKVVLVSCEDPMGIMLSGADMAQKLEDMKLRPLTANFRDALMQDNTLIPKNWREEKSRVIYFCGTSFIAPDGQPRLPNMYWDCGWNSHNAPFGIGLKDIFGRGARIAAIQA